MPLEIKVPVLPESVADGLLLDWNKQPGDSISRDEVLVEVETDKVVLEVPSPEDGVVVELLAASGDTVTSGQVLATLEPGAAASPPPTDSVSGAKVETTKSGEDPLMGPAVQRLVEEHGIDPSAITPSGPGGRLTKEDLLDFITNEVTPTEGGGKSESTAPAPQAVAPAPKATAAPASVPGSREEIREPMSRLRQTIATRLVQSQQTAAMLTTFNEVNMGPVMALRSKYKEDFEKVHGTRLGFMSFFVKASVAALQKFPLVNAYIDGTDLVRHSYQDIGIAVSSPRGLVVPVLRNCEDMSFSGVESQIREFGAQAKEGKINLSDLSGGTFTITNGGVFGSLLSTPIINPPQSAILGMHKIQDRPMAENGEVVVQPMMYLALSYDHRIVDGKEAVQFLVTIKDMIEDPARLLLDC
ncbi:MAG: 2-oxoglutarate dehydrogenase complex dihydrolipoyllysine-residue succinyltransferase [Acidiferrobacterales bacterium]|nr:2-oxoglutarate dehydrogenase complex dihydrolipoyllysine-residue succinyltransferase [Acidiferrobacterales bacterium]